MKYNWIGANECTVSGCYANESARNQYFAIRPEVSIIREAENITCNIGKVTTVEESGALG